MIPCASCGRRAWSRRLDWVTGVDDHTDYPDQAAAVIAVERLMHAWPKDLRSAFILTPHGEIWRRIDGPIEQPQATPTPNASTQGVN